MKIYIIEDDIARLTAIKNAFKFYNDKLKNGQYDDTKFSGYLKEKNIDEIKYEIISSSCCDETHKFYNYSKNDNEIIDKLNEIVNKNENRIFLLDLALNDEERDRYSGNENRFIPWTAKRYLEEISEKTIKNKEFVIFDTRMQNIMQHWKRKLMLKKDIKIHATSININSFDSVMTMKNRDENIYDTFKYIMEDKEYGIN